jgi:glycosyltransferase involved in cell wall biosynthesis
VLQEILALQHDEFDLHIASLQLSTDQQSHAEIAQVKARVDYLDTQSCNRGQVVFSMVGCLFRNPYRLIRAVSFFLRTRAADGSGTQVFYQAVCLAQLVSKQAVQHIHAHFASEPAAVAELVNQLTGTSFSISAHAKDIYLSPEAVLQRKIANARFVVTCTEYNCRYLQHLNNSSTPVVRVYHGFDPRRFEQILAQAETNTPDLPLILSVGRLREKKGFVDLIHACGLLKQSGYQFRCEIVGYGPQQSELEALIRLLDLEHIVLLRGQLIHTELITLYRQADIFALPCQIGEDGDRDGIPNVLMEAMAMKIPVVSTDISGIPELIEHQLSGLLVDPNKPVLLSKALSSLLDNQHLRYQLGRAGRQRVLNKFSVEPNIKILKTLFNQSIQGTDKPVMTELCADQSDREEESYAS